MSSHAVCAWWDPPAKWNLSPHVLPTVESHFHWGCFLVTWFMLCDFLSYTASVIHCSTSALSTYLFVVDKYGNGLVPPYLNQLFCVADLPGRRRLRSSTSYQLHVSSLCQLSVTGRFQLLQPSHGTLSLRMYNHPRLYQFSVGIWRHLFPQILPIYYYSFVFYFCRTSWTLKS